MSKVKSFAPCTWTFFWDNFNKTQGSHSFIYGDSNAHSIEVISRAALALLPPKSRPNKTCQNQCENSCYWEKERISNEINFDKIDLNNHEIILKKNLQYVNLGFF